MSRTTRLWLLVAPAAVVIGAAASALMYFSEHQDVPRLQAVLTALTGGSFITAGLIARTRRPLNRTGLLMIAVGFAWFVSAGLMASNESLPWTIGLSLSAVPAGFLVHLLIAYPSGRLQSRWELGLVVTGYVFVTVAHFVYIPVDADPFGCAPECPDNAFLVEDSETVRLFAVSWIQLLAVVYLLAVVGTLVGRWRHSSPAAQRALAPILLAGAATMFLFALSVGAQPFSETLPRRQLGSLGRADRCAVPVPLGAAPDPAGARRHRPSARRGAGRRRAAADARAARDPTAELLYVCDDPTRYVDVDGRPRELVVDPGRAVTPIEREGRALAVIVHDEALLEEPELLEQVAAAVGLEIERDQNVIALQASERRNRALVDAMPDNMFRISRDGVILDIQETPASDIQPVQAKVGSSAYDYPVPMELIERVMAAGRRALDTGELQTIEWTLEDEGEMPHMEGRFMPSGDDEFFLVVRDVTERKQREVEQAALHRVALAVASEARPEQIFDLVSEEIARVLGGHTTNLVRFEPGGLEALIVGGWRKPGARLSDRREVSARGHCVRNRAEDRAGNPQGAGRSRRVPLACRGDARPGRPVADRRSGHAHGSALGRRCRDADDTALLPTGHRGEAERLHPPDLAGARERGSAKRACCLTGPPGVRRRQGASTARTESPRRSPAAARLRVGLAAAGPGAAEEGDTSDAVELMSEANEELGVALEELRELARGIHPAVLTERGLGPALATLADRAPLPVEVDGLPVQRFPGQVEAAAYYVVSEALANVAKYADASSVTVKVGREDGRAVVEVADDGVGGANPRLGSGLYGLTDRIEALEGQLRIKSPPGEGT